MPALGQSALYRPPPSDFDETFVRLGWSGICGHHRAHWRTVVKWLVLRGRERLRAERRAYLAEHGPANQSIDIADRGGRRAVAEPLSARAKREGGGFPARFPTVTPSQDAA